MLNYFEKLPVMFVSMNKIAGVSKKKVLSLFLVGSLFLGW